MIADASLDDLDLLLDRCRSDVRIVRVAADEDGGKALADALAGRPPAIHLLAHGEPGAVRLGVRPLDIAALETDRHSWPQAPGTEILIHACDTGADGGRFAAALAQATGARVAAASHPVGHPSLGASWELDVTTGPIRAALPVSDTGSWVHRLAYTGTPTDGDDTLVGDDTGNTINGGAGNDSIVGGTGNDSLVGGIGDDTLVGGGNSGQSAGDTLNGGLGGDHYVGGNGFTIVTYENATTGITLDLTNGANNTGEAAGDTFVDIQRWVGSEHDDSLTAGDTAVWFWGHGGNDLEHGGAGNDTLEAGDGNDTVFGGGGNDLIYGRADNDELHGDAGNDTVAGGGGADLIYGGDGNDLLKGDWERDTIHGGDGDDTILAGIVSAGSYGQAQADQIFGEAGNDRYIVVSQYDAGTVSFDGGEGTDTLEIHSDDLSSYNGYDLEYYTDVASPAIDLTGMTLAGVERLELTGSKAHDVTLTGVQAAGFEVIAGSAASDTLRIAGSADLSAVAMSGIEAIEVTGSNATLTLAASQLAGLALTGNGNALAVAASGTGATVDLSGAVGFGRVALTGTAGADDLTVGAGATVIGNGGDDVIRIAAGTAGAVTIADAAVGDRLVMTGADLSAMQVETGAGSTTLRVGTDLAVTLTGSFAASQFQVGSGGSVTIVQANGAPVAEADKTVTAQAAAPVALGIVAPTDADGDALTVTVTGLPAGGTIRLADGTAVTANQSLTTAQLAALTFTAAAGTIGDAGSFTYTVSDGHGGSAGQSVALTVNAAPVAEADKAVMAQAATPVALGIAAPTDANGDALTVTVTGLPAGGTIRLADGTAVTANQSLTTTQLAALTFTAAAGTVGAAGSFAYTVADGHGGSAGQSVTLTVNAAPVTDADKTVTARQDAGPVALGIAAPTDANGDVLSVTVTGLPTGGALTLADGTAVTANQSLTLAQLAALTFTPATGTVGNAGSFAYRVEDGHGGVDTQTIGLTVEAAPVVSPPPPPPPPVTSSPEPVVEPAVNSAPVVQADKTVSAQDRTAVSLGIAAPTDADGDALTVTVTGLPGGGTVRMADGSAVAVNQTLTAADLPALTFLAADGMAGNAGSFAYRVDDGHGGVAAQSIALQVAPSADPASTTPQAPAAGGLPAGFNALAYIASYPDLIAAFGTNTEAATQHYLQAGQAEGRTVTFNPLAYTASYPDLIGAFGTDADAAARHYIQSGYSEGRSPNFDGLAYIASYPDLTAAFGTNAEAGTRHFIQSGYAEGRSVTFDGYNYLAANHDVALAFGIDANAAAQHYIQFGQAEGRPAQGFDALRYIASNPDLIQAFGPDVQAAEIHYVRNGYTEGRSLTAFDPAAYLATNPEIATEFGTSPAAVELAYIKRSTSTAAAAMAAGEGEAPIAVTMLAAGMTGAQSLGIGGGFYDGSSSGMASGLLASGDGGLSTRQRTELPA
nr:Ig-like domain-containing protein [Azospirillum endophyticum]